MQSMDTAWTAAALRRDEQRLGEFVARYLPMVWGVALYHLGERQEAADLCRRVMLAAIEDLEQVADPRVLRRWLQLRTLAAVREALPERRTEGGTPIASPEEPATGGEAVLEAVSALPAEMHRTVILRQFLGQTFASIGARTGLDRDGVDRCLRRAKNLGSPGRAC